MNLSFFIASRYFRSKKKRNFITILSRISMIGVAVGTMALVIVLSVFNGLEDLIRSLYASFDAELKIESVKGKSFEVTDDWLQQIRDTEGVEILTEVIEDNALFKYKDYQHLARLKGVSENYLKQGRFNEGYIWGELELGTESQPKAIIGRGVGFYLSMDLDNEFELLQVFYPKAPRNAGTLDPRQLYSRDVIKPSAFFSIEKEFDDNYIIAPLNFVKNLLNYGQKRTSIEIKVKEGFSISSVKKRLKTVLGEDFSVKDTDEQHAGLLRTIKVEKLFVFITLSFILAVASFNIFFSLSMMAIEKKKDTAVLIAMGAKAKLIKKIYIKQGAIIAFSGATIGLFLGFIVCLIQDTYGIVSLGISSSVIDNYPVKMIWTDFLWTSVAVITITFLASYRPAVIASKVKSTDL
ncbi:ABC-type transport system, involved in lipoprotein release, permease component [Belliella baltica DSM 15883]|uniref:ABC-type transport system, involved in lipoprotein release, permease component n=1 Tax=Belliella baltica (strain DSM 15883 / CIP 108006 / LMG 21964 / BA134) TaxID=866536 RepID=I3Z2E6_BELBD|nr:FtsX-like permease family protein [Belliella baltica]AFL83414.1 ABC-type transport system, involved in lipoprotein release, permease component [Belliella baltica DSM 15883]